MRVYYDQEIQVQILIIVIITTLNASTGKLFSVAMQHKHKSRNIKKKNEYDTWPPSHKTFFMLNSWQDKFHLLIRTKI